MKGIILAGGRGTRLYPATSVLSKQLLPVYDKPLVYYPLSTLIEGGIREILIITDPQSAPMFRALLGPMKALGISISFAEQSEPRGIAEAFLIGEEFIGEDDVTLILGDNIFYGDEVSKWLQAAGHAMGSGGPWKPATVFAYHVSDPERYGVVRFSKKDKPVSIEEKPRNPKSNYAVTGLYVYPNDVIEVAKRVQPSARGELEITDVNRHYLENKRLVVAKLPAGVAWLDTGTHESMLQASEFIAAVQNRQGILVGSPEGAALKAGFVDPQGLGYAGSGNYAVLLKRAAEELSRQEAQEPEERIVFRR